MTVFHASQNFFLKRAQNSIQNDGHSQRCNLATEPPIFTVFAPYATSWTAASATCVNHVSEVTHLVWEEFVWQPEVLRKCVVMRLPRGTKKFQFTTLCPCGQRNETPVRAAWWCHLNIWCLVEVGRWRDSSGSVPTWASCFGR